MNKATPIQLTFGSYGHTLHHCQIMSPDNQWIVYDIRNEDSAIGTTTRIERVHTDSKTIEILYEVAHTSNYGPGVGAATYSPNQDCVLFIHGLQNATSEFPYAMNRRSGVGIFISHPNQPIHFDARNCNFPYTKGALRGGTHSHCWHPDGNLISFTYNDAVLSEANIDNERVVGIMFPQEVNLENENAENFSGKYFSAIVSRIVNNAQYGSDEIEKAFDECWVGNKRTIAFQGWVRDSEGNRKTEIFIIDLPQDLTYDGKFPLEGDNRTLPHPPEGVGQKRVTRTLKGVSGFRHWLRSSPDGQFVYFLMEDEFNCTNIFSVNIQNSEVNQVTFHNSAIHSPFNISPNGHQFVYLWNDSLVVFDTIKRSFNVLIASNLDLYGIPNFDKNGEFVYYNQYVEDELASKFLQIFKMKL